MSRNSQKHLMKIYALLLEQFGPQHWWPGDTPFEVSIGAILTQNTNWGNVERAITNLKQARALGAKAIHEMPAQELAELIRPAGYFNIKAGYLKAFVAFLIENYGGSLKRMAKEPLSSLRVELLNVRGLGQETADSILLYALEKPVFVVDAYTKRIFPRHGILRHEDSYESFQSLFMDAIEPEIFNEFHALIVMAGKTYCKPRNPRCDECPLGGDLK